MTQTTTKTRREWLAERGLAIAGARGKFSKAAMAALAESGLTFSDSFKAKPVPAVNAATGKVEPAAPRPEDSDYRLSDQFRFPVSEYIAREVVGGKRHSVKEVCSNCNVSLCDHRCEDPVIYGTIKVVVEEGSLA